MPNVHRILLVDSYDSFTYNLANLLQQTIPHSEIYILTNDALRIHDLIPHIPSFSAVVVGPGPGSPCVQQDIGIVKDLWHLSEENLIPVFGVCLGLQSLAIEHGWAIARLLQAKHGVVSPIQHETCDLFQNLENPTVVRYHSLHVFPIPGKESAIEAIAWVNDADDNGEVVMAIKHKTRPFWAVQYHPESVCTTGGSQVVANYWDASVQWSKLVGRDFEFTNSAVVPGIRWPPLPRPPSLSGYSECESPRGVLTSIVEETTPTASELFELLGDVDGQESVAVLSSAAKPGRFSIVACLSAGDKVISHTIGTGFVVVRQAGLDTSMALGQTSIWDWLQTSLDSYRGIKGHPDVPFWGGFVGLISYAAGLPSLGLPQPVTNQVPDVLFHFVKRSVVVDHLTHRLYVQSLTPSDTEWIGITTRLLRDAKSTHPIKPSGNSPPIPEKPHFHLPIKQQYLENIKMTQAHLASGDSYELCLTASTYIDLPPTNVKASRRRSWDIYKRALEVNPAPHACYIRTGETVLVSSSPERFLSCDREGKFQLRPIKGTVRKAAFPDKSDAEKILSSPKEFAENLMIVDLIRHDLFACIGTGVEVSQLCSVEEYETVWHSVSVVEGKGSCSNCVSTLGACLPPGSMTGAPKKRSVEILRELEGDHRGIYSGVCGYFDVGGGCDFSVIIRSCIKNSDTAEKERWQIGAGGAITTLSDPEQEWEEMLAKLRSISRAFGTD